jgi:hypothetical protein
MAFVDRPYVLAGTAVPDWLSVADRKVRLRPRQVEPFLSDSDPVLAAVAAGVAQHLADDDRFHRSTVFYEVSGELTRRFRHVLGRDDGFRCGFLGHIATELLLDAVLIERDSSNLDDYYAAIESLDAVRVQTAVNAMARRPTQRLATFIELFHREQFLRDYLDDERMLYRLNKVMRRVNLPHLPVDLLPVLRDGRSLLRNHQSSLLPADDAPSNELRSRDSSDTSS